MRSLTFCSKSCLRAGPSGVLIAFCIAALSLDTGAVLANAACVFGAAGAGSGAGASLRLRTFCLCQAIASSRLVNPCLSCAGRPWITNHVLVTACWSMMSPFSCVIMVPGP